MTPSAKDGAKLLYLGSYDAEIPTNFKYVWPGKHLARYMEHVITTLAVKKLENKKVRDGNHDTRFKKEKVNLKNDINKKLKGKDCQRLIYEQSGGYTKDTSELIFTAFANIQGYKNKWYCFADFLNFCLGDIDRKTLPLQYYFREKRSSYVNTPLPDIRENIDKEKLKKHIALIRDHAKELEKQEQEEADETPTENSNEGLLPLPKNP